MNVTPPNQVEQTLTFESLRLVFVVSVSQGKLHEAMRKLFTISQKVYEAVCQSFVAGYVSMDNTTESHEVRTYVPAKEKVDDIEVAMNLQIEFQSTHPSSADHSLRRTIEDCARGAFIAAVEEVVELEQMLYAPTGA